MLTGVPGVLGGVLGWSWGLPGVLGGSRIRIESESTATRILGTPWEADSTRIPPPGHPGGYPEGGESGGSPRDVQRIVKGQARPVDHLGSGKGLVAVRAMCGCTNGRHEPPGLGPLARSLSGPRSLGPSPRWLQLPRAVSVTIAGMNPTNRLGNIILMTHA